MTLSSVSHFLLFLVGFFYIGLTFSAFQKRKKDSSVSEALSPWWPLNKDIYNEDGKKLCDIGRIIIVINFLLVAVIFIS